MAAARSAAPLTDGCRPWDLRLIAARAALAALSRAEGGKGGKVGAEGAEGCGGGASGGFDGRTGAPSTGPSSLSSPLASGVASGVASPLASGVASGAVAGWEDLRSALQDFTPAALRSARLEARDKGPGWDGLGGLGHAKRELLDMLDAPTR